MNVETGEIKKANELTPEQKESGEWKPLEKKPDPKCKKCFGRGYTGRNVLTNQLVMCSCVKRR